MKACFENDFLKAMHYKKISHRTKQNLFESHRRNCYKTRKGALKQQAFHKLEPQLFTQHCWIGEERLIIGNENGQVHVLGQGRTVLFGSIEQYFFFFFSQQLWTISTFSSDNGELKTTLTLGTQTIGAVVGFSRGFIAGCGGTAHVYEYVQGKLINIT